MTVCYGLDPSFVQRLLSLVYRDAGFGTRVLSVLEPAFISHKTYSLIYSILGSYLTLENRLPSQTVFEQLLLRRYYDGSITRETYLETLNVYRESLLVDPVPVVDAQKLLTEVILDVEILQALDLGYKCYKNREFAKVFSVMETAKSKVRLLETGSFGFNLREDLSDYVSQVRGGTLQIERLPIGVAPLDECLKGGLGRGQLGCVLAPAKDGKSHFLMHIAASNVILGQQVAYISLELKEHELKPRILANLTGIPIDIIESGGSEIGRELEARLARIFELGGNCQIKDFPSGQVTVADIKSYLIDLRKFCGFEPDIVIVDYADELNLGISSRIPTHEALGAAYTDLRSLGAKPDLTRGIDGFDCCVWTASQPQREAFGKDVIEMQDVARSILKINVLDLLISMSRTKDEAEAGLARFYIAACRYASHQQVLGPYARD